MTTPVLTQIADGIATLSLNRPATLNALNPDMAFALYEAVTQVAHDDNVNCVVITGAGEHFMAGGDINYFRQLTQDTQGQQLLKQLFPPVHGTIAALRQMAKPVIASAQGAIAGFGLSLLSACDLAIVADNSVFTLAYCHLGISPDGGSTYFLPRTVGLKKAMELVLLGERFDAQQALTMGLVNRVVPVAQLAVTTAQLAKQLANGPKQAYSNAKALLNASLHTPLLQQLDAEEQSFINCTLTADFAEGVQAFCEKRKPRFGLNNKEK